MQMLRDEGRGEGRDLGDCRQRFGEAMYGYLDVSLHNSSEEALTLLAAAIAKKP